MPLRSPLPPPLPPPPRLSWPGPSCLPRTIMPSTAAGRAHWAAAAGARAARGGPEGLGTLQAFEGAGRDCGDRPPGGLAGTMNRGATNSQPALLAALLPGKSLLLGCLPGHGPAGPPERRRRDREAGSCPSFLPSFEIKILSSGRIAGGGSGGLYCQPLHSSSPWVPRRTWASEGAGTQAGCTSSQWRPRLALRDARPLPAHLLPPALGRSGAG
jgi:hypothetical protein